MSEHRPPTVDRRSLFRLGLSQLRQSAAEAMQEFAGRMAQRSSGGRRYLRPPGAQPEAAFLLACERCHECVDACPHQAIRIVSAQGGAAAGTPYIDPAQTPCYLCLKCMPACPSGALERLTEPRHVRMGVAELAPDTCWAYNGSPCQVCFDQCPLPDEAIRLADGRPVIEPSACTGCGICAYACVSTPGSIRIKPS